MLTLRHFVIPVEKTPTEAFRYIQRLQGTAVGIPGSGDRAALVNGVATEERFRLWLEPLTCPTDDLVVDGRVVAGESGSKLEGRLRLSYRQVLLSAALAFTAVVAVETWPEDPVSPQAISLVLVIGTLIFYGSLLFARRRAMALRGTRVMLTLLEGVARSQRRPPPHP